jgi:hypothetical protein
MALIALYQWHETPALDFVIAGRAATAARVDPIGANISPEWGVNDLYPPDAAFGGSFRMRSNEVSS